MFVQQLIRENIQVLRQGIDLLERLHDEIYVKAVAPYFSSGVGKHLRHNLDHYAMFLSGVGAARIDYDGRQRDARIETDRRYAVEIMRGLIARLESLPTRNADQNLLVKMNDGSEKESNAPWSRSTVERELQFLLSHTIHHYALIALILKIQGVDCPADFGVAPSTLKYQRSQAA